VVLCRFGGSRAEKTLASLALLGLTSSAGASRFGAVPVELLSPLACSLPIYLAVYYLYRLQMPKSSSCLSPATNTYVRSSLPLLLYETLKVRKTRDESL
jgi:hypothetical protein